MAQFEQWFAQDFRKPIFIRHCESVMFTGDDKGAIVGVRLYNNETPYSGGGTVTGAVKRSDGGLVPLTGTLSGNAASVVISAAALAYPGPIGVHVVLTQGGSTTTVLKVIYSVDDNSGAAVDPGTIIPSVNDLITAINTAVASIPSDYSALLHTLAPDFSASTAYSAGDYAWYNGTLYRFTADHAAGSWTGTDAAVAVIGNDLGDLKSAVHTNIDQIQNTAKQYAHALHFNIGFTLSSGVYRAAGNNRAATQDFYPVGMLVHFVRNDVTFFYEYDFYSDNNEAAFMEYSPKWMVTNKIMEPPSGAKYFRLLLRNSGNTELSGNLDGKLSAYSISPNNVSAFYNAKYNAEQTPIVYGIDQFEYGYITGAEQTYGDVNADNASRRVRTKQGRSLHLLPGVILRLTDYDTYYMRVFGIRTDTGAHIMTTTNYHTDYTIPYEGDYSLLFGRTDNADLNAVDFVTDIFSIIYDKGHTYDYDWLFLRGINHTGYSTVAPANTLPAFKLSKTHGFHFVESDVRLTSDNVPVMIHNATIDETSDGTGNVADMTYQQLLQYDFGSWKSAEYAGTKIPSFDQYIELCRNIQLYPYIELKEIDFPETVILNMVNICKKYGMLNAVTWISYDMAQLKKVLKYDKHARVGFIAPPESLNIDTMLTVTSMKTGENRVFVDGAYGAIGNMLGLITDLNLEAEVYTLDDANYMRNFLSPRVLGATSNTLNYPEVIMARDI